MLKHYSSIRMLCLAIFLFSASVGAAENSSSAIDEQVWQEVARTVVENDIDGMAAVYHPDAILVSANGTVPIGNALQGWGEGMAEMQAAGSRAEVAFRFSQRQDGEQSAFETGLFRYVVIDADGSEQSVIIQLEALLIKKNGQWTILMERQLDQVSEDDWLALE